MGEKIASIKTVLPISIAVAGTYSVSYWGLYAQPQLLIPLAKYYQVSEVEIGQLFGVENFVYFLSILMATIPATKYSRKKLAIMGSLFLVGGNILSAFAGSMEVLMITRAIASIGGGVIAASGTAAAAGSASPERTFAIGGVLSTLIFAIGYGAIPHILANFEIQGVYLSLAAYGVCVLPAYWFLTSPFENKAATSGFFKLLKDAPYRKLALFAMVGLFIYELGQNGVFTYIDKLGANAGVGAEDRGIMLLLSTTIAMLGGGLAAWIGTSFGHFRPVLVGLGFNILIGALFTIIEDPSYYVYMILFWKMSYSFIMPYLMGTLASLDREGRWAVAGDAFWNFASTPGPVIATLIVTNMGYNPLAIWVLTSGAIGMALFCYTARQSDELGLE
jgi:predicted MFS family arabinose efflux permease